MVGVTRWKLAEYLEKRGFSAYALAKASGITQPNTIYRIAKPGKEPTRIDLPTLTYVLDGLRKLTGEDVQIADVLEYVPDAGKPID